MADDAGEVMEPSEFFPGSERDPLEFPNLPGKPPEIPDLYPDSREQFAQAINPIVEYYLDWDFYAKSCGFEYNPKFYRELKSLSDPDDLTRHRLQTFDGLMESQERLHRAAVHFLDGQQVHFADSLRLQVTANLDDSEGIVIDVPAGREVRIEADIDPDSKQLRGFRITISEGAVTLTAQKSIAEFITLMRKKDWSAASRRPDVGNTVESEV